MKSRHQSKDSYHGIQRIGIRHVTTIIIQKAIPYPTTTTIRSNVLERDTLPTVNMYCGRHTNLDKAHAKGATCNEDLKMTIGPRQPSSK